MARAADPSAGSSNARGIDKGVLSVLALLVLLAAALRLRGIGFLLPQRIAQDEIMLVAEMQHLRGEESGSEPIHPFGSYPNLLPGLAACLPRSGSPLAGAAVSSVTLADRLADAAAPWRKMRIVVALLSVLIVPVTWFLGRRLLGSRWALVAAALMAVSVLDIWFSQQARPHGPAAALDLLAVLAAMRMRERPSAASYFWVGLTLSLAVGCLQSGLAVLPPIVVAFLLRRRGEHEVPRAWALLVPGLLLVSFPVFYWFLFESHPVSGSRTSGLDESQLMLTGHQLWLSDFDGSGFLAAARSLWSYEPMFAVLLVLGLVAGILRLRKGGARVFREHPDLAVALAFVIPYVLVIGAYHRTYQRFLLPLLPYLACLVAFLLRSTLEWIGPRRSNSRRGRWAAIPLVLVPVGLEAFAGWRLVSIRASADTLTLAADWIASHLRPGEDRVFALPRVDLPLLQSPNALLANEKIHVTRVQPWSWYQFQVPPERRPPGGYDLLTMPMNSKVRIEAVRSDPDTYLRGLRGDYAVIEVYDDWGWGGLRDFRLALQRVADRVARFAPSEAEIGDDVGLEYQDYPGRLNRAVAWTWRVLQAERAGPVVEIYRFRD